jgi:hypothetical protein
MKTLIWIIGAFLIGAMWASTGMEMFMRWQFWAVVVVVAILAGVASKYMSS